MSIVQQLIDMGFPKEKSELAAKSSETLEAAIDWIMAHDQSSDPNDAQGNSKSGETTVAATDQVTETASSYKCNECGKLFRDEDGMMFHASKTKHEDFSESSDVIKPLSEEEKAEKVKELREKIRAAREAREQKEMEEKKELEKRRKDDMKAMLAAKEARREKEMLDAAAQRKREKLEAEMEKRRVLEQIRMDREARKAREAEERGQAVPQPVKENVTAPVQAETKNYDETMLQIRLLDGKAIKQKFNAKEPLAMVRAWIETNHSNGIPFNIMTPFPRKVFTEEDMTCNLQQLELVPSANIVITRSM